MSSRRISTQVIAEPPIKAAKLSSSFNTKIHSDDVKKAFSVAFTESKDFKNDCGIKFCCEPFAHCIIKDFISDKDFIIFLKEELCELEFVEKCNDLYKFQQSNDLTSSSSKHISAFRDILFDKFRSWLQDTTQIQLEATVDMSCTKYEYTDVLLCHDDELEGRRIAFIYYLVPEDWNLEDGGSLDLFATGNGFPTVITKSLVPSYNSLVFFEVTEKSFHQVSEVISETKTRLSLSGWFHGDSQMHTASSVMQNIDSNSSVTVEEEILLSWINPMYLSNEVADSIAEQFAENSEIQLKDFLLINKYDALMKELASNSIQWSTKGPPNLRWYSVIKEDCSVPPVLYQLQKLVRSLPFFKLLTKFTGINLAVLGENGDNFKSDIERKNVSSTCFTVVRKWKHGCYTLLHDQEACKDFVLDGYFYFLSAVWSSSEVGGSVIYLSKDDNQQLLTVHPQSNCLSLVYRDEETMRFVKYINHRVSKSFSREFYDLSMTYFEDNK